MRGFKNSKKHNKVSGNNRVTYEYNRLNEVCGDNPNITPLCTSSSSGLGDTQREQKKLERELQEDEVAGPSKKRVRAYTPKSEKTSHTIISWLEAREERQRKEDQEKMDRIEKCLQLCKNKTLISY